MRRRPPPHQQQLAPDTQPIHPVILTVILTVILAFHRLYRRTHTTQSTALSKPAMTSITATMLKKALSGSQRSRGASPAVGTSLLPLPTSTAWVSTDT